MEEDPEPDLFDGGDYPVVRVAAEAVIPESHRYGTVEL